MDVRKRDFILRHTREVFMTALTDEVSRTQDKQSVKEVYAVIAGFIEQFYDEQRAYAEAHPSKD